jgi:hypothetical protein
MEQVARLKDVHPRPIRWLIQRSAIASVAVHRILDHTDPEFELIERHLGDVKAEPDWRASLSEAQPEGGLAACRDV